MRGLAIGRDRVGAELKLIDEDRFEQWMTEMRQRYRFAGSERHAFPVFHKDRKLLETVYVEVFSPSREEYEDF